MNVQESVISGKCMFRKMYILASACSGKCNFLKVHVQENVISGKCTFREMYIRDNVVSAKCFSGKCNFCKVFFREVYRIPLMVMTYFFWSSHMFGRKRGDTTKFRPGCHHS